MLLAFLNVDSKSLEKNWDGNLIFSHLMRWLVCERIDKDVEDVGQFWSMEGEVNVEVVLWFSEDVVT